MSWACWALPGWLQPGSSNSCTHNLCWVDRMCLFWVSGESHHSFQDIFKSTKILSLFLKVMSHGFVTKLCWNTDGPSQHYGQHNWISHTLCGIFYHKWKCKWFLQYQYLFSLERWSIHINHLNPFQQTIAAWRTVFLIASGLYVFAITQFLFFAKASVQPWNTYWKVGLEKPKPVPVLDKY